NAPVPDPLVWLTWVGAHTTTLRLATGVMILPLRNPVVLAIVGEVVDPLPPRPSGLTVVSLIAQFGEERALADPVGCVVELALEHVEH
ncbi:MAG: LLM class flavin-dependent oxidoreductase, partial [Acidimicrobiia bacterium]